MYLCFTQPILTNKTLNFGLKDLIVKFKWFVFRRTDTINIFKRLGYNKRLKDLIRHLHLHLK